MHGNFINCLGMAGLFAWYELTTDVSLSWAYCHLNDSYWEVSGVTSWAGHLTVANLLSGLENSWYFCTEIYF